MYVQYFGGVATVFDPSIWAPIPRNGLACGPSTVQYSISLAQPSQSSSLAATPYVQVAPVTPGSSLGVLTREDAVRDQLHSMNVILLCQAMTTSSLTLLASIPRVAES